QWKAAARRTRTIVPGLIAAIVAVTPVGVPDAAALSGADSKDLVFIDVSVSVRDFAEAYRVSIRDIASVARGGSSQHGRKITFLPIGTTAPVAGRLAHSQMTGAQLRTALAEPFGFTAKTTKIAQSLNVGFSRASPERVMIISDFTPDHRSSGTQWQFSRQDLQDLIESRDTLDAALSGGQMTELRFVLIDWSRKPADLLSAQERRDPDRVIARAQRTNRQRLGTRSGPNVEDRRGGSLYQKATAAAIFGLAKKYPDLVKIDLMPRRRQGELNELQFFLTACSVFPDIMGQDPRCAGGQVACVAGGATARTLTTDFTVGLHAGRRASSYRRLLEAVGDAVSGSLSGGGLAVPRQLQVAPVDTEDRTDQSREYLVKVCPVTRSGGALRCAGRFARPTMGGTGWQLFARSEDDAAGGSLRPVGSLKQLTIGGSDSLAAASRAMSRGLRAELLSDIRENHAAPPSTVWVTLKRSNGQPMPQGQRIRAQYQLAGQSGHSDGLVQADTGSVVLTIPTGAKDIKLVHYSIGSTNDRRPGELSFASLPDGATESCRVQNAVVPDWLFVPRKVTVTFEDETLSTDAREGQLSVRLAETNHLQNDIDIQKDESGRTYTLGLPPGRYRVRFKLKDQRLLMPPVEAPLWPFEFAQMSSEGMTLDASRDITRTAIEILVKTDPVVRAAAEQNGPVRVARYPNYIGDPSQLWAELQSWVPSGERATRRGQRAMLASANSIWSVIAVASNLIEQTASQSEMVTAERSEFLRVAAGLKRAFESFETSETNRELIQRALDRVGLLDSTGQPVSDAFAIMKLMFHRIADNDVCAQPFSSQTASASPRVIAGFNEWLIQSAVLPAYRPGSVAAQREVDGVRRAESYSPFTQEFVRQCRIASRSTATR
ncbi:MAG: hypothetical protein AAFY27_06445, partial [Pseudomonadota bacterium]